MDGGAAGSRLRWKHERSEMDIILALLRKSLPDPSRELFHPCHVAGAKRAFAQAPDVQDSQETVGAIDGYAEKSADPGVPEDRVDDGQLIDLIQDHRPTLRSDLSRKTRAETNMGRAAPPTAEPRRRRRFQNPAGSVQKQQGRRVRVHLSTNILDQALNRVEIESHRRDTSGRSHKGLVPFTPRTIVAYRTRGLRDLRRAPRTTRSLPGSDPSVGVVTPVPEVAWQSS